MIQLKEQLIAISGCAGVQVTGQITGPHVLKENQSMWTSISMLIRIIIHNKKGGLVSTLTGQAMITCYST
jgi:hypothetical protein